MNQQLLMGNEAMGLAAIEAGVNVVCGYPGTPSTEVLETVAKNNPSDIYVEWSVNEKAAMELAAGAAISGARTLVTMKQVGLNVASDPLMSLAYIGVKGGMVVLVADDPGPISSQTEQDTRLYGKFSKLPVFDPATPKEAGQMMKAAFDLSEACQTPVILRPTTRVCHSCESISLTGERTIHQIDGFVKDSKWVIFPRLSYQNHLKLEENNRKLAHEFSASPFNSLAGKGKLGIASGGASFTYVKEIVKEYQLPVKLLKIGTPHPFPIELAKTFLNGLEKVLTIEDLDPFIEENLALANEQQEMRALICGKKTGHSMVAGENSYESVKRAIFNFLEREEEGTDVPELPPLPVRPPSLCAGCPHRASFYAVKQAMKGTESVFTGDIGCYTLGNAQPLDMVDTCLCMGADITMAQGIKRACPEKNAIAFIGDSTFFHTGIPGVIDALYNETNITVVILDNSTTAMTGHQPHPGTGKTMMGNMADKISIPKLLEGLGVEHIRTANPLNLNEAVQVVKDSVAYPKLSVVIFQSPCIAVTKPAEKQQVRDNCVSCKRCITEIGCPAISLSAGKVTIDQSLCYGCTLCKQVCKVNAIGGKE